MTARLRCQTRWPRARRRTRAAGVPQAKVDLGLVRVCSWLSSGLQRCCWVSGLVITGYAVQAVQPIELIAPPLDPAGVGVRTSELLGARDELSQDLQCQRPSLYGVGSGERDEVRVNCTVKLRPVVRHYPLPIGVHSSRSEAKQLIDVLSELCSETWAELKAIPQRLGHLSGARRPILLPRRLLRMPSWLKFHGVVETINCEPER